MNPYVLFGAFLLVLFLFLQVFGCSEAPNFNIADLELVRARARKESISVRKVWPVVDVALLFDILVNPELEVFEVAASETKTSSAMLAGSEVVNREEIGFSFAVRRN